jgi:hypothetical protein
MSAERISPLERLAAQTVTGPLAFLVAGLIDLSVFTGYALRGAIRARIAARRATPTQTRGDGSTI